MNLVNYVIAITPDLPPINAQLYEYIFAANGVFIRAKRSGMEAMWLIGECEIRGLADIEPYFLWEGKQIPIFLLDEMLMDAQNTNNEVLWYLYQEQDNWAISKPEQLASSFSVIPVYESFVNTNYEKALVEVHSHGDMPPFFSSQDNADEQGFRVYAILGCVKSHPAINVRIGLAGYFCPIPASMVFEDFDKHAIEDIYER